MTRTAQEGKDVTPAALRKTRTRLGLSPAELGRAAGHGSGHRVAALERSRRSYIPSHAVRMALLGHQCAARDVRLRPTRRARAALVWAGDPRRAALEAAAGLLDAVAEAVLADWLLRACPACAIEVATNTAVHALLRGEAAVFDTLMEAGLIDDGAFMDAYLGVTREFVWSPDPAQLLP